MAVTWTLYAVKLYTRDSSSVWLFPASAAAISWLAALGWFRRARG